MLKNKSSKKHSIKNKKQAPTTQKPCDTEHAKEGVAVEQKKIEAGTN